MTLWRPTNRTGVAEMAEFVVTGQPVAPDLMGTLRSQDLPYADGETLRAALAADGYLLLRGALPRTDVLAARAEVFGRLAEVGEIEEPAADGISTGNSDRAARYPNLAAYWQSVSEGAALRQVTHGAAMADIMAGLLDAPPVAFDFVWLRPIPPGRASPFHFDHVYMNRGSAQVQTCWIPLGDVTAAEGPITVVEGSHRFDDLIAGMRGHDVDRDPSRSGTVTETPLELARARGKRLLSAEFAAGDVLIFGMFLLHGSADNIDTGGRTRLSCDVRYQPRADARDDRWFGQPPAGHGGRGYGGVSASQPLLRHRHSAS